MKLEFWSRRSTKNRRSSWWNQGTETKKHECLLKKERKELNERWIDVRGEHFGKREILWDVKKICESSHREHPMKWLELKQSFPYALMWFQLKAMFAVRVEICSFYNLCFTIRSDFFVNLLSFKFSCYCRPRKAALHVCCLYAMLIMLYFVVNAVHYSW